MNSQAIEAATQLLNEGKPWDQISREIRDEYDVRINFSDVWLEWTGGEGDVAGTSNDHFNRLVNDDIRDVAPEVVSDALRAPENVERWYLCLLANKNSVESQLATGKSEKAEKKAECEALGEDGRQEWFDFLAQHEKWRSGAIRFRGGTDVKLKEAKEAHRRLLAESPTPMLVAERNTALARVVELEGAILKHRDLVDAASEEEAVTADEDLWKKVAA